MPLMTDAERKKVGICYKQQGQQVAINLGHKLVSENIKAERVQAWVEFAQKNPQGFIYCFRGGLRSKISKRLSGLRYQRLESAMQDALEQQLQHEQLDAHRIWIQALLENYYDPMYHYQQQKNKERVCFADEVKEVQAYLQTG